MYSVFKDDVNENLSVYVQQLLHSLRGETIDEEDLDDSCRKVLEFFDGYIVESCRETKDKEFPEALAHVRKRLVEVFS